MSDRRYSPSCNPPRFRLTMTRNERPFSSYIHSVQHSPRVRAKLHHSPRTSPSMWSNPATTAPCNGFITSSSTSGVLQSLEYQRRFSLLTSAPPRFALTNPDGASESSAAEAKNCDMLQAENQTMKIYDCSSVNSVVKKPASDSLDSSRFGGPLIIPVSQTTDTANGGGDLVSTTSMRSKPKSASSVKSNLGAIAEIVGESTSAREGIAHCIEMKEQDACCESRRSTVPKGTDLMFNGQFAEQLIRLAQERDSNRNGNNCRHPLPMTGRTGSALTTLQADTSRAHFNLIESSGKTLRCPAPASSGVIPPSAKNGIAPILIPILRLNNLDAEFLASLTNSGAPAHVVKSARESISRSSTARCAKESENRPVSFSSGDVPVIPPINGELSDGLDASAPISNILTCRTLQSSNVNNIPVKSVPLLASHNCSMTSSSARIPPGGSSSLNHSQLNNTLRYSINGKLVDESEVIGDAGRPHLTDKCLMVGKYPVNFPVSPSKPTLPEVKPSMNATAFSNIPSRLCADRDNVPRTSSEGNFSLATQRKLSNFSTMPYVGADVWELASRRIQRPVAVDRAALLRPPPANFTPRSEPTSSVAAVRKMPVTNTITGTTSMAKPSGGIAKVSQLSSMASDPTNNQLSSRPTLIKDKRESCYIQSAKKSTPPKTLNSNSKTSTGNANNPCNNLSESTPDDEDYVTECELEGGAELDDIEGDIEDDEFMDDGESVDFGDNDDAGDDVDDDDDGNDSDSVCSTTSAKLNDNAIEADANAMVSAADFMITSDKLVYRREVKQATDQLLLTSDERSQPALTRSLFPNVPPTINFVLSGQKVEQLPSEYRRLLKWRMSPITPNVVKLCIARSGFKPTSKNHTWIGYWGRHMKAQCFKAIREYQKVNHFPASFQLGRKDRLWHNLSKMQMRFGRKEFGFFPQTYVLPTDLAALKNAWDDGNANQKWIIKPPASARGIGIRVVSKWSEIPKRRAFIVQHYIAAPYLINESKFDLRIYVYVTSYDPLRVYVYDNGLARFASVKYSRSMKSIHNRYMHLTNYSINRHNSEYQSNSNEATRQGHKWTLKALWAYLQQRGVNTGNLWNEMKDLIVKTIISSEAFIGSAVKANVRRRYSCHELFGFDILLDENLKPWVLEVNISPSLHSNSALDINVKGAMIRDLLNIAGYMLPNKDDVLASASNVDLCDRYSSASSTRPLDENCIDRRLWPTQKSSDERAKHVFYCQKNTDLDTILNVLTPDDIRILIETINEDSRRGNFVRVFPTISSSRYHQFFEQPRYYNLLLDAWLRKYARNEMKGINLLRSYCAKGIHLQCVTNDPKHQWSATGCGTFYSCRELKSGCNAVGSNSSSAIMQR